MEILSSPFALQTTEAIKEALKHWHQNTEVDPLFSQFYLYRRLQRKSGGNAKLAVNQLLNDSVKLLQETYEQEAQFLQARYLDDEPMHRLVNRMNMAESSLYVLQRQAIQRLTETVLSTEQEATASQKLIMLDRLQGHNYDGLVGIEAQRQQLQQLLTVAGPPWIVAIEGIGGIGKTALAHALLRQMIEEGRMDDIGWISARQEELSFVGTIERTATPALTAAQLVEGLTKQLIPGSAANTPDRLFAALRMRLKELPHIIVIDNLETIVDVESLLPTLQKLANPTKFILTSRESLYGAPSIYHAKVEALALPDALQLIRQEANLRGLPVLAMSSDAELQPIYETVGGNPLALRLVVGQSHVYPLRSILYDLQQARSKTADNLYTFIYRKAWEKLNALSRRALLTMPLASPRGDDLDYLAEVGDLDVDELRMALNQLVTLNLVDAQGGLNDRRYGIHSLTRTFLLKQIVKWM